MRRFWEIKDHNLNQRVITQEERAIVQHFESSHLRSSDNKYIVLLPTKTGVTRLGESRMKAIKRFINPERLLQSRGTFKEFVNVVQDYFELNHAEPVPTDELEKKHARISTTFPRTLYRKEDSTTSKIRVVFDASAESALGTSLNDHLLIGPTAHSSLIYMLLRFRLYQVTLTIDVKLYAPGSPSLSRPKGPSLFCVARTPPNN